MAAFKIFFSFILNPLSNKDCTKAEEICLQSKWWQTSDHLKLWAASTFIIFYLEVVWQIDVGFNKQRSAVVTIPRLHIHNTVSAVVIISIIITVMFIINSSTLFASHLQLIIRPCHQRTQMEQLLKVVTVDQNKWSQQGLNQYALQLNLSTVLPMLWLKFNKNPSKPL